MQNNPQLSCHSQSVWREEPRLCCVDLHWCVIMSLVHFLFFFNLCCSVYFTLFSFILFLTVYMSFSCIFHCFILYFLNYFCIYFIVVLYSFFILLFALLFFLLNFIKFFCFVFYLFVFFSTPWKIWLDPLYIFFIIQQVIMVSLIMC